MLVYHLNKSKIPVKIWRNYLSDIELSAMEQIDNLINLPFAFHHIAIMPDVHTGYGMPIGGVLATKDVIIPNAVGVDIGCGMCALKTSMTHINTNSLKEIMGEIRKRVPVGFDKHKELQNISFPDSLYLDDKPICKREYNNSQMSIGSLGSGNHFIEIQKDKQENIWIMIHSGSRNLGKQVADYYNKLAIEQNKKWYSLTNKENQLAFLPVDSEGGTTYLKEMQYCVDFAFANRRLMMKRVVESFHTRGYEVDNDNIINIAHNYVRLENHFGKNVWVHRKGATSARQGEIGIIPGSQGTKSYIVEGLGNKKSFESCSHGAGRKMSRTEAKRELNLNEQKKLLDDKNIIHGIRNIKDLDEAPGAYKDIDEIIYLQKKLIKVIEELTPIAVIKG